MRIDFNVRNEPLSDLRVRQAIAHALDKELIAKNAWFGLAKVARSCIRSAVTWAHNPNVKQYAYDPGIANRILDEAGYAKDKTGMRFKLRILYDVTRSEFASVAETAGPLLGTWESTRRLLEQIWPHLTRRKETGILTW
jgi:ABC-type transport system substrate-binding protein